MANKNITLQSADGLDNLYPKAQIVGIDETNILATGSPRAAYQFIATEDCYYYHYSLINSGSALIQINSVEVMLCGTGEHRVLIPVKKGQTLRDSYVNNYTIFGVKH